MSGLNIMSGLNLKSTELTKQEPPVQDESQGLVEEGPAARWSSHPIDRYCVADFQFEKGLLTLETQEEADAFQAVYDGMPLSEQTRLKKIDLAAAEAMVRQMLGIRGGATKGIDSSTGDRQPNKQIGTGDLLNQN